MPLSQSFKNPVEIFLPLELVTLPDGTKAPAPKVPRDKDGFAQHKFGVENGYYVDRSAEPGTYRHLFPFALTMVEQADHAGGVYAALEVPPASVPKEFQLGVKCQRARRVGPTAVVALFQVEKLLGTQNTPTGKTLLTNVLAQTLLRGLPVLTGTAIANDLDLRAVEITNEIVRPA